MKKRLLAAMLSVILVGSSAWNVPAYATEAVSGNVIANNEFAIEEMSVSSNVAVSENTVSQNEAAVEGEGAQLGTDTFEITEQVVNNEGASKKKTSKVAKNLKVSIKSENLVVTASIKKSVKSSDKKYYLVTVDPDNGKVLKAITSVPKKKKVEFKVTLRKNGENQLIFGKYAIAVKKSGKLSLISEAKFISNPEDAAVYTAEFPACKSKKGMQGLISSELGGEQYFMNIVINSSIASNQQLGGTKYVYDGKTYWFNDMYSGTIAQANQAGMVTTAQFMMQWPGTDAYGHLLLGTKSRTSPTSYYAINASNKKSRKLLEAYFSFLAERMSKENCHLDNWIIGNEVNIYPMWSYAGNTSHKKFTDNYANLFRIVYYAVKGYNKNARVYICTDHTWNDRCGDWGAKSFMSSFNKAIKAQEKSIKWNLAYHAYPAILTQAATWNDSHTSSDQGSEFVTPKNLNLLSEYVKKNFGNDCRIILSEQGFTANSGANVQAAAMAYTFYKAQFDSQIDAVIFRSEIDQPSEVAQGLSFGLKSANGKKRAAYNVYKYMDTPQYAKYTNDCLKTIGASSWESIVPGFSDAKIKELPGRK